MIFRLAFMTGSNKLANWYWSRPESSARLQITAEVVMPGRSMSRNGAMLACVGIPKDVLVTRGVVGYACRRRVTELVPNRAEAGHYVLPEQPQDNQDQNDHEQHVNEIAALRDLRNARRTKISQQPEHQQDDDDQLDHARCLSGGMS